MLNEHINQIINAKIDVVFNEDAHFRKTNDPNTIIGINKEGDIMLMNKNDWNARKNEDKRWLKTPDVMNILNAINEKQYSIGID